MTLPPDPTLEELRAAAAEVIPSHAAFDGFTDAALASAAAELGVDAAVLRLAFPDGALGMVDAWFASVDRAMAARLPVATLAALKIRTRIAALVAARLEILLPHREALRRALAVLALPTNVPAAARLGWRAADAMWRLAGDTAVDLNHYTKRTTLGAIYAATLLVFLDDDSEDLRITRAFLDRRIEDIMRFERTKAALRPHPDNHFNMTRFLGRLRYPAR